MTTWSWRVLYNALEIELIYGQRYRTRSEAQVAVFDYIEIFYDRLRFDVVK